MLSEFSKLLSFLQMFKKPVVLLNIFDLQYLNENSEYFKQNDDENENIEL